MDRKWLDKALEKNYISRYCSLIEEYEIVKQKRHSIFRYVKEFYIYHKIERKSFLKYYNRFIASWCDPSSLFPQKRWPRYKTRRPDLEIESKVVELRKLWNNKYEIHNILKKDLKIKAPSPSWVYNILKRNNLNKMPRELKEIKRKIIKERIGELWHIDCHYLKRWIIEWTTERYYLVWLIDDYSRIAECQVVSDIKSLTVMFWSLRCINILKQYYWIEFESIMTDNWVEFWWKQLKDKGSNPFERLLIEMWIKHIYTKPYRPQTNWKIERFWRTIEEDFLEWTSYKSMEELNEELIKYMYYYNFERPHSSLDWKTPANFAEKVLPN